MSEERTEFLLARTAAGPVAVETGYVRGVESEATPTRVPGTANAVAGVVDTDGDVTVVVDAGTLFGGEESGEELVVLDGGSGEHVGLRVDAVDRVVTAPLSAVDRPTGDGPTRARVSLPDGPSDVPVVDVAAVRERASET